MLYDSQLLPKVIPEGGRFDSNDLACIRQYQSEMNSLQIGDTIYFGYNAITDGRKTAIDVPIIWRVLAKSRSQMLFFAEGPLFSSFYNGTLGLFRNSVDSTWATSAIRRELNTAILDYSFTELERRMICEVDIHTDGNSEFGTNGGEDTCDSLFLLSVEDIFRYFPVEDGEPVPMYLRGSQPLLSKEVVDDDVSMRRISYYPSMWWLRTPGMRQSCVCYVQDNGVISMSGCQEGGCEMDVRPAMWIDISRLDNILSSK